VQIDGGLHRALLPPRREKHERPQDDEQREEDNHLVHDGNDLS
jgi:hypothetical protein